MFQLLLLHNRVPQNVAASNNHFVITVDAVGRGSEDTGEGLLLCHDAQETARGWKHLEARSLTFGSTAENAAVCSELRGPPTWALRAASPCSLSFLAAWRPPGSQTLDLVAQAPNVSECSRNKAGTAPPCLVLPGKLSRIIPTAFSCLRASVKGGEVDTLPIDRRSGGGPRDGSETPAALVRDCLSWACHTLPNSGPCAPLSSAWVTA